MLAQVHLAQGELGEARALVLLGRAVGEGAGLRGGRAVLAAGVRDPHRPGQPRSRGYPGPAVDSRRPLTGWPPGATGPTTAELSRCVAIDQLPEMSDC